MITERLTFDEDGDLLLIFSRLLIDPNRGSDSINVSDPEVTQQANAQCIEKDVEVLALENKEEPSSVHMLVASKNLIATSPVFKAMLKGLFKESHDLLKGKATVHLPEDDPAIFKIVMDILHLNARHVPRRVDLETLTDLALLADKYQMADILNVYGERWTSELRTSLPTTMTDEVLLWIFITWIFRLPTDFERITKVAIMQAESALDDCTGLRTPTPTVVLDAIEAKRQLTLAKLVSIVGEIVNKYQVGRHCDGVSVGGHEPSRELCDAVLLGSMLRSAKEVGIWPLPSSPYIGTTVASIMSKIRLLKTFSYCDTSTMRVRRETPSHGMMASLEQKMNTLEAGFTGLNIHEL